MEDWGFPAGICARQPRRIRDGLGAWFWGLASKTMTGEKTGGLVLSAEKS